MTTLLLWALYAAGVAGVAAAARFVRRPIPAAPLAAFVVLPLLYLLPGFVADRTAIPVEDVRLVVPWTTLPPPFGTPEPHRNPNLNDIALQIAPWNEAVRAAWRSGTLPWLDRWNGCGMPLAANGQSAAFSPFTFAGLPLPLGRAFTLAEALKLLLALCGAWLWLSELRVSRASAFVGALAFGFSLLMTVWLPWPIASVVSLWPWALFLLERLDDAPGRGRAAGLIGIVLLGWAAGGHPESAALGAAFALLWTGFRLLSRAWKDPVAVVRAAALAAILAVGLSAPLLVPQLEAIRASNRQANVSRLAGAVAAQSWAPHAPRWKPGFVTPLFPRAYGDAARSPMLPQAGYSFPEISSAYAGAAAWVLALLTLRPGARRRREVAGLAVIAGAAVLASTWTWPAVEVLARVPVFNAMMPLRYSGWIPLVVAALAAFELDRWRADVALDRRRALWLTAGAAAFGIAAGAVFLHFRGAYSGAGGLSAETAAFGSLGAALAAIGAAGVLASLPRLRDRARPAVAAGILAAASVAELFAIARPLDRFGRSSGVFPPTPLVAFLRGRPGPFRTAGIGVALFPNANVFAGVEDVRTHDPLERRDYVAFLDAAAGYPGMDYFKSLRRPGAPALDALNLVYVVGAPGESPPGPDWRAAYSGPDGVVFRNPGALPRVWAPETVVPTGRAPAGHREDAFAAFGRGPAEILAAGAGPKRAFVVSDGAAPLPASAGGPAPALSDFRESGNTLTFTADVPGNRPRVVVASEVQDGGWRAADESGPLAVGRANGPFLAIAVRPGRHRVTLSYAPPGLGPGLAIAAATALAALFAAAVRRSS